MQSQNKENIKCTVAEELVGQMNEGTAIINGYKTNALIDTGSQVTTISKDFYDQHLLDCDIHSVETLKVVGAGGQDVPFLGYISVNISFPENEAGVSEEIPTLALIVPNTAYNQRVPAVIGTNLLRHYASKYDCMNKTERSQTASSAWHRIFQANVMHEKFVQRASGQPKIKSTLHHPLTIGAHESIVVFGLCHTTPGFRCKAMVESTVVSRLPPEVAVTPSLVCLAPGKSTCKVPVEITNNSGLPVTLPPKIVIGELHLVSEVVTDEGVPERPST